MISDPRKLPVGWVTTTIGTVCFKPQYGWTTSGAESGTLKLLRTTDIAHGPIDWTTVPFCRDDPPDPEKYLLVDGDIVISRAGSVGLSYLIESPPEAVFASYLIRFRPKPRINRRFVSYALQTSDYWRQVRSGTAGIAVPNVNASKVRAFRIQLAPLVEQDRVVTELDKQVTRVDAAIRALHRLRRNLEKYRRSILNAAIDRGTARSADSHARSGWRAARLEEVCNSVTDGDHQPPPQAKRGIPFLTIGNISGGSLDFSSTRFVPKTYFDDIKPERVPKRGDVLYSVVGATIGIPVVVNTDAQFCFQRHLALLKPSRAILPRFLWAVMASPHFHAEAWRRVTGSAQPTLPLRALRNIEISIPSVAEQEQIVRDLDHRLSISEQLTKTVTETLQRAAHLRQAIIDSGLRGELVSQESNETPAEQLLVSLSMTEDERQTARSETRPTPRQSTFQKETVMSRQTDKQGQLEAALTKSTKKISASHLLKTAGYRRNEVYEFYDALAEMAATKRFPVLAQRLRSSPKRRRSVAHERKPKAGAESFRLIDLWIEKFKNLENYSIQFDPQHALDVLLGWNGTGKSNLFEGLVVIFRDLHRWRTKHKWLPDQALTGYRLRYEIENRVIEVEWNRKLRRPVIRLSKRGARISAKSREPSGVSHLLLPHFVFGYYSGPSNRFAELFSEPKQDHYERLLKTRSDKQDALARLLEERRFFCAETHHAKYALLAFFYRDEPTILSFLRQHLRIEDLESVLFVFKRPRWHRNNDPTDFWGAQGLLRPVLERIRRYAIAPLVVPQRVDDGYKESTRDHMFLLLPDKAHLQALAGEYTDPSSFFVALESTDFSSIIHDVRIRIKIRSSANEQTVITFKELSEGEQQLLVVLGLLRFTKTNQSLVLLDEPDTHLNPHWQIGYLHLLLDALLATGGNNSETSKRLPIETLERQLSSQVLLSTHDPLAIASLLKENIHLQKRESESEICVVQRPLENPRGMGFTGILTSEMFGLRSDLDYETLSLLDRHAELAAKEKLSSTDKKELRALTNEIEDLGFKSTSSDPYYRAFLKALMRRRETKALVTGGTSTSADIEALANETDSILKEIEAEEVAAQ